MTNEKNDGPEKICCKCTRRADHFWDEEGYCHTHWADKLASLIAKGLTPWQKESEKQKDMDSFIKEHLVFLNDKNTQFYQYEPKNKIPTVSESPLSHGSDYRYCIRCGIMIGPIENHPDENTHCVSCWKYEAETLMSSHKRPLKRNPIKHKKTAQEILNDAEEAIGDRAKDRDTESERSMRKAVEMFNTAYGKDLTEEQGWMFACILKIARSSQGAFRLDDYIDGAAYFALAAESVLKRGNHDSK